MDSGTTHCCSVLQTLFFPSLCKRKKSGLAMRDYDSVQPDTGKGPYNVHTYITVLYVDIMSF